MGDPFVGIEIIKAWREIEAHLTNDDIAELEELDQDGVDISGTIIGFLIKSGIEPEHAEELLTRAGFLEGEPA